MIAVTEADMKTATRMANPSIQAVLLWLSSAVPTSTAIATKDATIKILRVKSSSAYHKSWQNPGGYLRGFSLVP